MTYLGIPSGSRQEISSSYWNGTNHFLKEPIMASVSRTTAQSMVNNATTLVSLSFSNYSFGGSDAPDTNSTNNGIIINKSGYYLVSAHLSFLGLNSGFVELIVHKTTTYSAANELIYVSGHAQVETGLEATKILYLNSSDLICIICYQSTGGNKNTSTLTAGRYPRLQVEFIR